MKNFFVTSISKTDEGYEQLTPHNGGIRIINLQNKQEMIKAFCDSYDILYDRFVLIKNSHSKTFLYDTKTDTKLILDDYSTLSSNDFSTIKEIPGLEIIKGKDEIFVFSHCLIKGCLKNALLTHIDNTIIKQVSPSSCKFPTLINIICSESMRDNNSPHFNIIELKDYNNTMVISKVAEDSEKICSALLEDEIVNITSEENSFYFKNITFNNSSITILEETNSLNEVIRIFYKVKANCIDIAEINKENKYNPPIIKFDYLQILDKIFIALKDSDDKIKYLFSVSSEEIYIPYWPTLNYFEIKEIDGDIWIQEINPRGQIEKLENFTKDYLFESFITTNHFEFCTYNDILYIKELDKNNKIEYLYLPTDDFYYEGFTYPSWFNDNIEIKIIDNNFAFYNPFDKVLYKYNDNNMLYVEKQDK